jgi:Silencing defective 2 N-terminal ubiquitin domain
MASRKRGPQDKSAMRDLSGRRLKAVQQAKELAQYLAEKPGLERKAREEKRKKLEGILAMNPADGIKMDDHVYWEDKERLVEGVKSAVKEAVRAVRKEGGKVKLVATVEVKGGGVKKEMKFTGFDEEYDSSDEEDGDEEMEDEEEDEEEEGVEEDEDEGSTEEESSKEDIKGKTVA